MWVESVNSEGSSMWSCYDDFSLIALITWPATSGSEKNMTHNPDLPIFIITFLGTAMTINGFCNSPLSRAVFIGKSRVEKHRVGQRPRGVGMWEGYPSLPWVESQELPEKQSLELFPSDLVHICAFIRWTRCILTKTYQMQAVYVVRICCNYKT